MIKPKNVVSSGKFDVQVENGAGERMSFYDVVVARPDNSLLGSCRGLCPHKPLH